MSDELLRTCRHIELTVLMGSPMFKCFLHRKEYPKRCSECPKFEQKRLDREPVRARDIGMGRKNKSTPYVLSTCLNCGKERWIRANRPTSKGYTGLCKACSDTGRKRNVIGLDKAYADQILALIEPLIEEIEAKANLTIQTELALERDAIKRINELKIEEAKRQERERIRKMPCWLAQSHSEVCPIRQALKSS